MALYQYGMPALTHDHYLSHMAEMNMMDKIHIGSIVFPGAALLDEMHECSTLFRVTHIGDVASDEVDCYDILCCIVPLDESKIVMKNKGATTVKVVRVDGISLTPDNRSLTPSVFDLKVFESGSNRWAYEVPNGAGSGFRSRDAAYEAGLTAIEKLLDSTLQDTQLPVMR